MNMMRLTQIFCALALSFVLACEPAPPPEPVDACGDKCGDGQVCIDGECKDKICEPFRKVCADSTTLQTCNGNGTDQLEEQCPTGTACVADTCTPTVCVPGSHFCGSDGVRQLCGEAGIAFSADPCPSGQGCTGSGECVAQVCEPLSVRCITEGTRDVERCSAAGTEYYTDRCNANELCYGNACLRVICAQGDRTCLDTQTTAECDATGTGWTNEVVCEASTGAICDPTNGQCASACEVAASTKSYIACDYWFAITDNMANDTEACGLPSGQDLFPSAIVIANTNDVAVQVTLTDADGAVITLPAQQSVAELPQQSMFGCATPHSPPTAATVDSKILVGSTVATVLNGQEVNLLEVPPGATAQLLIVSPSIRGTRVAHEGYNLVSTLPVSAYLFNPICCNFSYSNDASLLIPRTAWRQAYFLASAPHLGGSFMNEGLSAGLAVIAAEDNTQVALRLRPGQSASQFKIENGVPAFSGDELRTTLNAGDVLQLETAYDQSVRADVTGVLAAADKPIGVFGFHRCTYVPQEDMACDHVEEMMLPVETWGTDYIAVMPKMRNPDTASTSNRERMYYRFVSSAATNRIQVLPVPTDIVAPHDDATLGCPMATDGSFVLDEGQFCEFGSRDGFKVTSAEPILVMAIFSGQDATGLIGTSVHAGDPSLAQMVPVDQFRKNYSFLTPDTYYADYVTVIYKETSVIELDGVQINTTLLGPYGANELVEVSGEVPGSGYASMTIKLARGAHMMRSLNAVNPSAEGDRFGIFSYGYDDYVSYAYPGGLDLVQTSTYPNIPSFP